jgi:hypothetical protein
VTRGHAVAAGGLVLALVACGDGGGGRSEGDGYDDDERSDFVEACSAGATTEACGCFYDRLAAEVPHERFEEIDQQIRDDPNAIPADIADLAIACSAVPDSGTGGTVPG